MKADNIESPRKKIIKRRAFLNSQKVSLFHDVHSKKSSRTLVKRVKCRNVASQSTPVAYCSPVSDEHSVHLSLLFQTLVAWPSHRNASVLQQMEPRVQNTQALTDVR